MDRNDAAKALAEIERRTQQTVDQGGPRRVPLWYSAGTALAVGACGAGSDFDGWPAANLLPLAAVLVIVALTFALERTTGVRLRTGSMRKGPLIAFGFAVVAAGIVVGTILRLYDVPLAGTISGVVAGLVWVIAMNKVQAVALRPSR
jgi:hypothetical protein